jgi:hypothetical protein
MAATSCDKLPFGSTRSAAADPARSAERAAAAGTKVTANRAPRTTEPPPSPVLFQVFGERSDARMLPVATLKDGRIQAIRGPAETWRAFDRNYSQAGLRYTLYRDGAAAGKVEVARGMWTGGTPLYSLPGCTQPTPLARVRVDPSVSTGYTVEFLASNAALGRRGAPIGATAGAVAQARATAMAAGARSGVARATLDSLDFRGVALHTGATTAPTVIGSFVDPAAGLAEDASGAAAQVFVIADRGPRGYAPTLEHVVRAGSAAAEYVRYVDHLDVDGDGLDEIFVERWRYAGRTALAVLSYRGGRWTEIFRARENWCLDDVMPALSGR